MALGFFGEFNMTSLSSLKLFCKTCFSHKSSPVYVYSVGAELLLKIHYKPYQDNYLLRHTHGFKVDCVVDIKLFFNGLVLL